MTEPTDAEIDALWRFEASKNWDSTLAMRTSFARAALARWGQPAHSGEPVAWYEYNADLDAWFLAYNPNPKAKTRPLVFGDTTPQPTQAQAGAVPMSHEKAKALVLKYGIDPLHLVLQVERYHGIKGGQHGPI